MAYLDEVLADTPVLHWRLGESSGTTATDASGNNRSGTYSVDASGLTSAGLLIGDADTAVTLVRASSHIITRADEAALDLSTAASAEAWINFATLPASGQFHPVVTKNSSSTETYAIDIRNNAGSIEVRWHINTGAATVKTFAFGPVANTTYHLVGTYDGANMRIYVNGVQVGGDTAKTGTITASTDRLTVGSWSNGGDFFGGTVDEVALYGTALSGARVAAHYAAGTVRGPRARPDFTRNPFALMPMGDWRREGRGRPSFQKPRSTSPAPGGGFERFIFPRLHQDYPAAGGIPQDLTATVTTTATTSRQVAKNVTAATVTIAATVAKQVVKTAQATVNASATMVKRVGKPLSATVALTASLLAQKVILKTLTASTVTISATIAKQVGKAITGTVTTTATMVRQVAKLVQASAVTVTASQVAQKVILKALTATAVTTTASITRRTSKALSSTVTLTASAVKQVAKALTVTVTTSATLAALKVFLRTLTATLTTSATMIRQIGKPLTVTTTVTATLVKQAAKRLTATVTATASLIAQRVFLRVLTATVTTSATVVRRTGKLVTATVTSFASVTKRIGKTVSAVITAAASLLAQITGGQPVGHIDGQPSATQTGEGSTILFAAADGKSASVTVDDNPDADVRIEGDAVLTGRID